MLRNLFRTAWRSLLRNPAFSLINVLGIALGIACSLIGMLSKDFIGLVAIAVLIASPVAWLLMENWLREYAYRTNITW